MPPVESTTSDEASDVESSHLFSPRTGHHMSWKVSLSVGKKNILGDVHGSIRPHELCCIMGHSGSGKTSLLNVLAGKPFGGKCQASSDVKLDGVAIDTSSLEWKRRIAFVAQTDSCLLYTSPSPRD